MNDIFFPVDINAVKKYGVARWQKEFFWPVSDNDFFALCADLEACMARRIAMESKTNRDTLLIKASILLVEYYHFLHAQKVILEISRRNSAPLYTEKSLWYCDIIRDTLDKRLINTTYASTGRMKMMKIQLRRLLRNLQHNWRPEKFLSLFFGRKKGITYGAPNEFIKTYIRSLPYAVSIAYCKEDWMRRRDISSEFKDILSTLSQSIIEEVQAVAARHQIILTPKHLHYLLYFTKSHLEDAAILLTSVRRYVKSRKQLHLITQHIRDPLLSAMAIAVRDAGGKVTSLTHGGAMAMFDSPTYTFSEFAISDEFVAYTRGSAKLFERMYVRHRLFPERPLKIISGGSDMYLKMRQKFSKESLPTRIKKILVVGDCHNPWRKNLGNARFSLMQLDLELRLIDVLRKVGYQVVYKPHPDRMREIKGIFDTVATIATGDFEQALTDSGACIFGNIRTTAFAIALCTNKPVIGFLVRDDQARLDIDVRERLEKRCRIVYMNFDEHNRLIFGEEDLLSALAATPAMPNMEFVEQFMYP
ncbi:MAG: hypothetical protein UX17_C0002G0007 [Parcubacteria group bacterium GW2011_GWC2_45_7]|nr:MAG: hypothetical protein UX17_C0002G0007 [Parcubacteria group bacterium GW2011_GWC2_45_7]KKU74144.1 MAG: hypothetical protein UX98_C0001G0074 [Parcubacteria group bacterium GW2011_GWA2_47_26]